MFGVSRRHDTKHTRTDAHPTMARVTAHRQCHACGRRLLLDPTRLRTTRPLRRHMVLFASRARSHPQGSTPSMICCEFCCARSESCLVPMRTCSAAASESRSPSVTEIVPKRTALAFPCVHPSLLPWMSNDRPSLGTAPSVRCVLSRAAQQPASPAVRP